jgi:hypothetical protein
MSWLSKGLKKAGKGLKKLGKNAGKVWEAVDDYALPAVGFALGGPAGAALGSATARGIGDGKFNPKAVAGAGLKGYAMGQLGSMAGLQGGQGLRSLGSSAGNMVRNPGAIASNVMGGGPAANISPAASSGGGWTGGLQKLGRFALDNPELIGAAASTIGGLDAQRKADRNEKKQMQLIEAEWARREPLRTRGFDYLNREPTPLDLSVYRNSANPFSR